MKLRKKLGALALATTMVMTMLPVTAFAEGEGSIDLPTVTVNTEESSMNGMISVQPIAYDGVFSDYNVDEGTLSEEERTAFLWANAVSANPTDCEYDEILVKVVDKDLTDEETETFKSKALHSSDAFITNNVLYSEDIEIYVDGTLLGSYYGGLEFTASGVAAANGDDAVLVQNSYGTPDQFVNNDGVMNWQAWNFDETGFVVLSGKHADTCVTPIDTVEIKGATLTFNAGDEVAYTGQIASDLYSFDENRCESWEDEDYNINLSSGSCVEFDTFEANKTYRYQLSVVMTDDAYYMQGYYFPETVKLIINGKESGDEKYVSDEYLGVGRCVDFYNVAQFTTGDVPSTNPGQGEVTPGGSENGGGSNTPSGSDVKPSGSDVKPSTTPTGTTSVVKDTDNKTDAKRVVEKKASVLTVKAKTVKAKAKKTTKIKKSKVFKITGAAGKVTFKKVKGNKKITVSKSGKITVKKGLKKGKTYKIKVKVSDKGNATYKSGSKTVTVKVKIK